MKEVEFFWDVASPYSYLASTQVARLRDRGLQVRFRPFLLGGVFKATGNTMPAALPAKARYLARDIQRWAELYRVPIRTPGIDTPFPINSLVPMRVAVALDQESLGEAYCHAVYRAYWVEGRDVSEPEVLTSVVAALGRDAALVLTKAGSLDVKDRLRRDTAEAVERGAFGAPSFFVGDEYFWGNDRVDMVLLYASRE